MPTIEFENRAVAFIDVLGFKELVKNSESNPELFSKLQELVNLLCSAVPMLDVGVSEAASQFCPSHLYISDCIVLSAPLSVSYLDKSYSGLDIVVMRVSQLTHLLLSAGYLVRGGIAIGAVWHGDSNIVGPAYQEAFSLERCATEARVILSHDARAHWKRGERADDYSCLDYDGCFMVNGLYEMYVPRTVRNKSELFVKYEKIVTENAADSSLGDGQKKWQWYLDFVRYERDLNSW